MYQTYEEQKNDKIDFTKMDNNNLCERCKNSKIMLTCEECSPFHNFCQIITSLLSLFASTIPNPIKFLLLYIL